MRVPFNDLKRQSDSLAGEQDAAVLRVARDGPYVMGPEVAAFEAEFAAYCGVPHCHGVANGTDALEIALRAVGVTAGGKVAMVANAGFYSATAALAFGAVPVYVDVDPRTHLMDPDALTRLLARERPQAIVATHLYGAMADMPALIERAAGIPVIEDCAQAHGASLADRRAGSFGKAAAFSFYPTKNLGGIGDAGAVVTGDAEVAARIIRLRQYGWTSKYRVEEAGGRNSRLDPLQAAVLRLKLPRLDGWNERRRQIARRYADGIANARIGLPSAAGESYVAHLYVVTTDGRDDLRRHLEQAGVGVDIHYPIPDTLQPVMSGRQVPALPATEDLSRRILTLPCFPQLTDAEIDYVVEKVNSW